ncbi:hypothetical protein PUN28_019360 [Cardiocondyla obscurior]|uniref:Ribosomal protein L28 n=1 Tax=Cardiocondyla obscurior TaxID=286306 RepID=A0AAW2EF85_9HYME
MAARINKSAIIWRNKNQETNDAKCETHLGLKNNFLFKKEDVIFHCRSIVVTFLRQLTPITGLSSVYSCARTTKSNKTTNLAGTAFGQLIPRKSATSRHRQHDQVVRVNAPMVRREISVVCQADKSVILKKYI